MSLLILFLRLCKINLIRFLRWGYNFWQLSKVECIQRQILNFPIVIRQNGGKLKLNGKNDLGQNSLIYLSSKTVNVCLRGNVQIGEEVSLFCHSNLDIASNVSFGKGSSLNLKGSPLIIREGFYLGELTKMTIMGHLKMEQNFKVGSNTYIAIHGHWEVKEGASIASGVNIGAREPLHAGNLFLGIESQIGPNTIVDLCDDVYLADGAIVGPNCVIYTHNHDYKQANGKALGKADVITAPVYIGQNSWIGTNVIILPGVTIGDNVVVAAGSVVTKSIPANCLVGGVPAKVIKELDS